jgi:hypothetical protein
LYNTTAGEVTSVPKQPTKDTTALYLELPAALRQRLDGFVDRNRRKLKGEVANAIEQYLDREEAKEDRPAPGFTPLPAEDARPIEVAPPARRGEGRSKGRTPK